MATKPTAEILVDLDTVPALNSLQKFGDDMRATSDAIRAGLQPLRAAWDNITGTISTAVAVASKWANAASEVERVEKQLASAFKIRGDFTGHLTRTTLLFNQQLEKGLG